MAGHKHAIPEAFLEDVERFVALANALSDRQSPDRVRAVTMFATARCNAFRRVTGEQPPRQTIDRAVAYFGNECETMFFPDVKEIEPVDRTAQGGKLQ